MDVTIYPSPNPGIGAALVAPPMRSAVTSVGEIARALYWDRVAKRTRRLAASARISTEVETVLKGQPRWVCTMRVGGYGPLGQVDYAASHDFGTHRDVAGPQSAGAEDINAVLRTGGHHGAHDLNAVLAALGSR